MTSFESPIGNPVKTADVDGAGSASEAAARALQRSPDGISVLAEDRPLRIFVAVAERLFLQAFAAHLDHTPGLSVVATAIRGQQAVAACLEQRPDLIVLDLDLPGLSGVGIAQRLRDAGNPAPIILLLSDPRDSRHVAEAWAAGVRGFMLKQGSLDELVYAIRTVPNGGIFVDSQLAHDLVSIKGGRARDETSHGDLTPHERDVMRLFARGYTSKEIAHHLGMSATSAEKHKARAVQKLDLSTRASIVRYGIVQGWFEEG